MARAGEWFCDGNTSMLRPPSAFSRAGGRARILLAWALALAALALSCATARASVQIVSPGGGAQSLDLSQLPGGPDVPDRTYGNVATPGGAPTTVTVTSGYSLPKLLKAAGITHAFGSAEVLAPQGPPVILSYTQATIAAGYPDGPPVMWDSGAGTSFLVPSTPTGVTYAGETFPGPGGMVTVDLHAGPALGVGIYGTPSKAVVGVPVQFTANVFGGTPITYQWSFGDGALSTDSSPSHTFAALGTYDVSVQVTGTGDSVGASSVIHIVVGNPPVTTSSPGAGMGGTGAGAGSGTGAGGSGSATGTGAGAATNQGTNQSAGQGASASRAASRRRTRPQRPVGPVVAGILLDASPSSSGAAAAGGSARAARAARLSARAAALSEGVAIALGALALLVVGALLEWTEPWRVIPAPSRAQ